MDMSKLPRMSQTPPPPPEVAPDAMLPSPVYEPADLRHEPAPSYGEAWISLAVGGILMLMSPYTLQWLVSLVSSYKPPFLPITSLDSSTGLTVEVPYVESIFFFDHLCVFAFAVVLMIDGLVLLTRRVSLITFAFALTIVATLMNFIYVVSSTMRGGGLPFTSALAVAFGVYIAIYQWNLLKSLRVLRRG